jgi:hypothetical protein
MPPPIQPLVLHVLEVRENRLLPRPIPQKLQSNGPPCSASRAGPICCVMTREDRERADWRRLPALRLRRKHYGRVAKALVHPSGALLFQRRPRSRNARWHKRIACWILIDHGRLVHRRCTYGRQCECAPLRWATRSLRQYRRARGACRSRDFPFHEAIALRVIEYDELPRQVLEVRGRGPPSITDRHRTTSLEEFEDGAVGGQASLPTIPTMLPDAPPERTTAGRYARRVLTRDEYDLYQDTWVQWSFGRPELTRGDKRIDLATICMETVLQFRLELTRPRLPIKRWSRRYHASYRRLQAARRRLGATRSQRLDMPHGGALPTLGGVPVMEEVSEWHPVQPKLPNSQNGPDRRSLGSLS